MAQSRSTIACSSGAWSRSTTFAPEARRQLVRREVLEERDPDDDHEHRDEPDVEDLEEPDGEADVEQTEQPACQEHPQGEAGVASVCLALHRESRSMIARDPDRPPANAR